MTSYVSPVAFTTVAQSIPPNVFADMDRKVAAAVADGADVIDGKPSFLQAAEQWYRNTYGVEVDWKTQLFAVEGAVDGLAARLMVSRRCSPCLFRRAMLWHMRIRITPRIIA